MHAVAELGPAADVRPVEGRGHEQQAVGLLHHAAVDDLDREPLVQRARGPLVARPAGGDDSAQCFETSRSMPPELLEKDIESPREPRQVPVVAALAQEAACRRGRGFLDESLHAQRAADGTAGGVDVAKGGRGKGWLEADGDQGAGRGRGGDRGPHRFRDRGRPVDDMVGGQGDHHRSRGAFAQGQCRQPVGVGGSARGGLEDHVLRVDFGQDRLDDVPLPRLGQDEDLVRHLLRPVVGGAQQRSASLAQRQDVLRRGSAGPRPQTGAGAAGRDHGNDLRAQVLELKPSAKALRPAPPPAWSIPMARRCRCARSDRKPRSAGRAAGAGSAL